MVASVLAPPSIEFAWPSLLQPSPLKNGATPEQRVVFCGIVWNRYLALDHHLGNNRASPRLYYLDGALEIMTTSNEHERVKKWIGDLLSDFFFRTGSRSLPEAKPAEKQ